MSLIYIQVYVKHQFKVTVFNIVFLILYFSLPCDYHFLTKIENIYLLNSVTFRESIAIAYVRHCHIKKIGKLYINLSQYQENDVLLNCSCFRVHIETHWQIWKSSGITKIVLNCKRTLQYYSTRLPDSIYDVRWQLTVRETTFVQFLYSWAFKNKSITAGNKANKSAKSRKTTYRQNYI